MRGGRKQLMSGEDEDDDGGEDEDGNGKWIDGREG